MLDLNNLVADLSGWDYLSSARGISDRGYIVGHGYKWSGDLHAFLLTQTTRVPTPATLALFSIGLAGIGWARRKKS